MLVNSSKKIRAAVTGLPLKNQPGFRPLLEARAMTGSTDERLNAIQALATIYNQEALDFFHGLKAGEQSEKIEQAIETHLLTLKVMAGRGSKDGQSGQTGKPNSPAIPSVLSVPPLPAMPLIQRLTPESVERIRQFVDAYNKDARRVFEANRNNKYWQNRSAC